MTQVTNPDHSLGFTDRKIIADAASTMLAWTEIIDIMTRFRDCCERLIDNHDLGPTVDAHMRVDLARANAELARRAETMRRVRRGREAQS